jgi:hypothetical protein
MSPVAKTSQPHLTGEAAWNAERNAMDQRNAAAKRAAGEHKSPTELAFVKRERRLAQVETKQLNALNKKIAARRRLERAVDRRQLTQARKAARKVGATHEEAAPGPLRSDESGQ